MREMDLTLFSVDGRPYLVSDFVTWVNARDVEDLTRPKKTLIKEEVDAYVENAVLAYEDTRLEAKHNDFRLLMEEYHDGILLFELTDQKVWSRAVQDSAGLAEFHAANPALFTWPKRLDVGIHTCEDITIARCVKRTIRRKKDVEGLRRELMAERPLALRNSLASLPKVKMRLWTVRLLPSARQSGTRQLRLARAQNHRGRSAGHPRSLERRD